MEELIVILRENNISNAILIMNNVSFLRCEEIRTFVESNRHVIKFLPPYSLFFNPIEYMFSQFKSIVLSQITNNDNELMSAIDGFKNVKTVAICENYVCHVTTNILKCLSGVNVLKIKYIMFVLFVLFCVTIKCLQKLFTLYGYSFI